MAKVYIPTPYRGLTGGQGHVHADGATIAELIVDLDRRFPGLASRVWNEGAVRQHVNVFVNGQEMRCLQNEATPLAPNDEVAFIPALIGGSDGPGRIEGNPVIELTREQYERILRQARRVWPDEECCGLLYGTGDRIEQVAWLENVEHSRLNYRVHPLAHLLTDETMAKLDPPLDLVGFYHSHTHSPAWPSQTDRRFARDFWPDLHQIIVSLEDLEHPVLRSFRIDRDGNVEPEEVILR